MARKRRRRANWPYRFAWLGLWLALLLYLGVQTLVSGWSSERWFLSLIASLYDTTLAAFFFVVGACIGSFLNVVAYRLPLGKFIGGHSGCPYCQTPISSSDNIPILAWIKLRGRCRACRLPISVQYPLVELTVAIVFFVVFVSEYSSGGANLPGVLRARGGALRTLTPQVVLQLFSYLFLLSSLIAAALIAVKRLRIPLELFVWSILPLTLFGLILPETIVVPWRMVGPEGAVESRLDVIATLVCGLAAGMAIARLYLPLLYAEVDRSLVAADSQTAAARQFVGAMAVASCQVGWQGSVSLAWIIVLSGLAGVTCLRIVFRRRLELLAVVEIVDLTVWIWLGLLIFRVNWHTLAQWQILPASLPEVARHVLAALLLVPLVWLFARMSKPASASV